MSEMKTAAYLCTGCGIGDKLDVKTMEKIATKEGKMALVKNHAFLCGEEGVAMIKNDIANEGVTHVMIGACSRRAKTEAFHFPTAAMARANLREGVLWVVAEGDEHDEVRQEMADDYVRMGCAELKKMKVPAGNPNTATNKRVLVVGGGFTGMTAALEVAKTGYEVKGLASASTPARLRDVVWMQLARDSDVKLSPGMARTDSDIRLVDDAGSDGGNVKDTLPLLPEEAIDPWGALKPYSLWLLVLLISSLSLIGYVATRALGA